MSWSGLPEKIEAQIIPEPMSGCWLWLGALRDNKEGYGGLSYEGKAHRAHKFVYAFLKGPIPPKLDIDHLCRNRLCCNPDHLEPVTRKVNVLRGEGVAPKNKRKTHCPQGHEYNEENTYVWAEQRFCRTCSAIYKMNHYRRGKFVHSPEWFEKRDICKYLDSIGAWHFKPSMNGFGGSGVPDIVGCYQGRFFAIEVKREGKQPTKLQEKRMTEIALQGGQTFWGVARKVNFEMKLWGASLSQ